MTSRASEAASILKAARERAGLTKADVAKRVSVKVIYLESVERGRYVPSVSVAHRLVGILHLDADAAAEVMAVASELEVANLARPGQIDPRDPLGGDR